MAEDAKTKLESSYGGGQAAALSGLGHPQRFFDCVAVMFNKGGDNGYWMRLLGNENFDRRRVGALVITADALCYGELCATRPKPRSSAGMMMIMARGKERAFANYTWMARRGEIADLIIHPVNLSAHGAFASVEIAARGERVHIGVDVGRPNVQYCISALRHLADMDHDIRAESSATLRTDGLYLMAANTRRNQFLGWYFDDTTAAVLSLNDPAKSLNDLRSGEWEPARDSYYIANGHYLIEDNDPDQRIHAYVQPGGRLVMQSDMHRGKADEHGERTSEYLFVRDSELSPGWGLPTIPGPLPGPSWLPVLTSSGDLVAEELGIPRARVKG